MSPHRTVRIKSSVRRPRCSGRPYPDLSLACTSAPESTSAVTVSVWPFSEAWCSAVLLHSRHAPASHHPTRTSYATMKPQKGAAAQASTVPFAVLAVHVRTRPDQHLRGRRVALRRCGMQRRPSAVATNGQSTTSESQAIRVVSTRCHCGRCSPKAGNAPALKLYQHVRARFQQRLHRLRVAILRGKVQCRPPAQPT